MTTAPLITTVTSKVSPLDCGTPGASYQVINYSLTDTIWIGDSAAVKTNVGIPVQPQAAVTVNIVHLYAVLDNAATNSVMIIVGTGIQDWSPSPVKVVNISGPVAVTGDVGITGTVDVAGDVNANVTGGTMDINNITGTVTVDADGADINVVNTPNVQSPGQVLTNQVIPTAVGFHVMTPIATIPPWVRNILVIITGGAGQFQVDIAGQASTIDYTNNNLTFGDITDALIQSVVVAAILDPTLTLSVTNLTGTPNAHIVVIGVPDPGLVSVQNNEHLPLHVTATPDDQFIVDNLPAIPQFCLSATRTMVANVPQTILAAPSGTSRTLASILIENATGTTGVITFATIGGLRLQSFDLPGTGVVQVNYGGFAINDGLTVVMSIAGAIRYTVLYTGA